MATLAQEWIQEGKREGLWNGIENILEIKFGDDGSKLMPDFMIIEDVEILGKLLSSLKHTQTVDDVKELLHQYLEPSLHAG